jgi:hypothetical protein
MRSLHSKEQVDQAARLGAFVIPRNFEKMLPSVGGCFLPVVFSCTVAADDQDGYCHAVADAAEKRKIRVILQVALRSN